jgi:leucine dehydrogenase
MTQLSNIETPTLHAQIDFLEYGLEHQFGDLHFIMDKQTGMKGMIAIHSTKLGPALGGCRFISYPSTQAAIMDGMRLARGMSYKAALANLPLGGGKAVIIKPAVPFDRLAYMDVFGRFIEQLDGRYITALDSGTNLEDMDRIYTHTRHVASLSEHQGDPSPYTAKGVLRGIEAMVASVLGKPSLQGIHIAIQGLGHVGFKLAELLNDCGAKLTVADVDEEKTREAQIAFGAKIMPSDVLHRVECDVFSPCALGGIINDQTIHEIQAPIIAGAANNQLAHTYHGELLMENGIAYAVDYVINAGGLLFAASQYLKTEEAQVHRQIDEIATTLTRIQNSSIQTQTPPNVVADRMAEEKLK